MSIETLRRLENEATALARISTLRRIAPTSAPPGVRPASSSTVNANGSDRIVLLHLELISCSSLALRQHPATNVPPGACRIFCIAACSWTRSKNRKSFERFPAANCNAHSSLHKDPIHKRKRVGSSNRQDRHGLSGSDTVGIIALIDHYRRAVAVERGLPALRPVKSIVVRNVSTRRTIDTYGFVT